MLIQKSIASAYKCTKMKSEKVLKGNMGEQLYNIGMKGFFLSMTANVKIMTENSIRFYHIKV